VQSKAASTGLLGSNFVTLLLVAIVIIVAVVIGTMLALRRRRRNRLATQLEGSQTDDLAQDTNTSLVEDKGSHKEIKKEEDSTNLQK
jgi:hypothetical protein